MEQTQITSQAAAIQELTTNGCIKIGVVFAPAPSTFFVTQDEQGQPHGVTVDLGNQLAVTLGASAYFHAVPNSGELADAVESGEIDVAFMPVDDERKKRVAFGPAYFVLESTGLVQGWSAFKSTQDLNQLNVRVAGIANTTTIRSATKVLPLATMVSATSVEDAMTLLREGGADAVALSRDVLLTYEKKIPGTRILEGHLHTTGIAVAVQKGRPAALAHVTTFLENAKSSGMVRRVFDQAGLQSDSVAPPDVAP